MEKVYWSDLGLLTQQQAADMIGVDARTLQRWATTIRDPRPVRMPSGRVSGYEPTVIEAYLRSKCA